MNSQLMKQERKRLLLEKKEKAKQAREDRRREMEIMVAERQAEEARKALKRKENDEFYSPDNPALIGSEEVVAVDGSKKIDDENAGQLENIDNDNMENEKSEPEENGPQELVDPVTTDQKDGDLEEQTDPEEVDSESDADVNLGASAAPQKDYGSILFGDLQMLGSHEENSGSNLISDAECQKLVNFAVFCGFTNLRISEYPHDFNSEFSLAASVREQQLPTCTYLE